MGSNLNRWPDAANDRLRQLWAEGLTGRRIAEIINAEFRLGVTRNSVIGRVHRLGLPSRQSPIKAPPPGWKKKDPRRLPRKPSGVSASKTAPAMPEKPAPAPAPKIDRSGRTCQWIEGEPRLRQFCGQPCQEGSSYCPGHHTRVYAVGLARQIHGNREITSRIDTNTRGNPDKLKHSKFRRADAKWGL